MRLPKTTRLVWTAAAACAWAAATAGAQQAEPAAAPETGVVQVEIHTALGDLVAAIDAEHAPLTAANFLRYVDAGYYDGGLFHRTVRPDTEVRDDFPIEVVQASAQPSHESAFPPVLIERTKDTGLRHLDGTLSMARDTPDSATSDFFICIGDQPSLDYGGGRNPDGQGFAAFGRVVSGMDVVHRIQSSPSDGQSLTPPVAILSIRRVP